MIRDVRPQRGGDGRRVPAGAFVDEGDPLAADGYAELLA
jgi:hypothetical protein